MVSRRWLDLSSSPEDQGATFIELFFDLVFVYGITQVVGLMHHELGRAAAGHAILVFWMIWWGWTQYTWAFNAVDTTHPIIEFSALVATAIAFFMAVEVPGAFDGGAMWFAAPYVALRVVGLGLYSSVLWVTPEGRKAITLFATLSIGGLAAVLMGAYAGEQQVMFWALAIFLDVIAVVSLGLAFVGVALVAFLEEKTAERMQAAA